MSEQPLSSETEVSPVRRAWTLEELQGFAQDFMIREYGKPIDMEDMKNRRRFHEKLGFLVHFVTDMWEDRP